jgi:hypothetical protein
MVTTNLRSELLLSRDWNGETNNNSEAEVFRTASGRTLFAKIVYSNNVYSVFIENADVNGRLDASARLQIEGPTYMSFVKFRETSDGGVLVTGTATGYRDQALVFKLNASGSLDTSFGEQGVKRLSNLPDYLFNVVEVESEYWLLMADYFVSGLFSRLFILFLGQQFRCIKNGNIFAGLFMRHAVLYLAVDVQG